MIFICKTTNKKASIKEAFKSQVEVAGFEPATPCSQSRID